MDEDLKFLGRPPIEFKDEYPEMLIEHMRQGLSFESFGAVIGCSRDTLYRWAKEPDPDADEPGGYPSFCNAKKLGKELSLLFWEKQGISGLWGGKAFVPAVWIFNMRNRFQWSDKTKEESEENNNLTIKMSYDPSK